MAQRASKLLLIVAATASMVWPAGLRAGDDNVCAQLFARLAGSGTPTPAKKKATDFTKAEMLRIVTERPCIKHFPWPEGKFLVPEGTKKAVTTEEMGQISGTIRTMCAAWMKDKAALLRRFEDLTTHEQQTVRMLQSGVDPENLALYGEFMYALKLRKDGNSKKLFETIEGIRKYDKLAVETAPRDEFEDSTYFTKPSLRCMLVLLDYGARADVYRDEPAKLLSAVAGFLDDWPILQHHIALTGNPTRAMLAGVEKAWPELSKTLHLEEDYWKQTDALDMNRVVAGTMKSGEDRLLYLRGKERRLYALRVTRFSERSRVSLLSHEQASAVFDKVTVGELKEFTTPAMKLFRVLPQDDGFAVTFAEGSTAKVTKAEYEQLAKGEKLPTEHPLATVLRGASETSFILYSHPLMHSAGPELAIARDLTFALQKAYPELQIQRDPLSRDTATRSKNLIEKSVGKLDDVLILVAADSFEVPKNATVKNIMDDLATLGRKPQVFAGEKYTGPSGRTVIVITGHTSEKLAKYVRELGEAGYFKDNYVVFNSCESPLTEQLLTEMTTRYGAAAAFAHEKKIGIDEVQEYLLDFAKKVKEKVGQNLPKLLLETLHRHKLNGVWSICRAELRSRPDRLT